MLQQLAPRRPPEQMMAEAPVTAAPETERGADEPLIEFERVTLAYSSSGSAVQALAETSLKIAHGDFVALVGPSGCGKSTILQAGRRPDARRPRGVCLRRRPRGRRRGRAHRHGVPESDAAAMAHDPAERHAAAQDRRSHSAPTGRARRRPNSATAPKRCSSRSGSPGFGDKQPWQLSGGMQQRASLCRALIHDPTLLLLDEPFGALDQFTREELWSILQDLWLARKPTVLLVTHDLRESAFLANRIVVMSARPGRIIDDSTRAVCAPAHDRDDLRAGLRGAESAAARLIVEARAGSEITPGSRGMIDRNCARRPPHRH